MSQPKPDLSTPSVQDAAHFAHDLRNLLSSVLGHAELLLNKADTGFSSSQQQSLRALSMASSRAAALCEEMMDWAKAGDQVYEPISLSMVVDSACGLFESQIDRTIRLSWSGEAEPLVRGCPRRLERAVLNLLWNSRDSIQATGRGNGTIEVSWGEFPDGAWLEVSDDGAGLPDGELGDWTEAFASTRESLNETRGLGLHSVARTIQAGSGRLIGSNNSEKGGARMRLEFPVPADLLKS
ncbi:MAG TPA: HAMP domain-containing sensor histidine kinase [Planctomycetota bacterium]|jgi:signal transduction histidine kinase|nr:HAMP domain-containing sensor histidine kinase [Planctomycetota bacterium]MDP7245924.1 HAMP domain-containing sensor histidine kinase [Planctomycetota bacterium]MDP7559936.1 HAMP domain-containing sensor histidine kinase [Planctomycetota bacterium]HJM38855.1 HAMP domain-containing sensor histidine kinase [Planctomycetota bacterium]|tara:strand:+ start:9235 stop:9951 length:717 start_codon:yes stop_codon:yes gene_type:complete